MAHLATNYSSFETFLRGAESTYTVDFIALNGSGVSGTAILAIGAPEATGEQYLNVSITVEGMEPNQPVPQHIHGLFDLEGNPANSQTPDINSDTDRDGLVEVLEGVSQYGDVLLTLTEDGAAPMTNADGSFTYIRAFDLNDAANFFSPVTMNDYVGADILPLTLREIVLHGVSVPNGIGAGTPGEVNGLQDGFVPILPAAAGEIEEITLEQALSLLDDQRAMGGVTLALGDAGETVTGTEGDDVINGGAGDDVLIGLGGKDTLTGNGGSDDINGGQGDDVIMAGSDANIPNGADAGASGALPRTEYDNGYAGGDGDDLIIGGAGDDIITGDDDSRVSTATGGVFDAGADGSDTIFGGAGNDEIHTGSWSDGDEGLSNVSTGVMGDVAHGGDGDDILRGAGGDDILNGDAGNDDVGGGGGADSITGGAGDDVLFGNAGADVLDGGAGNDTLRAGPGDDDDPFNAASFGASGALPLSEYDNGYAGGAGDDLIEGGAGDDIITGDDDSRVSTATGGVFDAGADGSDTIFGGAGNDEIHTGSWSDGDEGLSNISTGVMGDMAFGGEGDDILRGAGGNDFLAGEAGNDDIGGGGGADSIVGGDGNDVLSGNGGDDIISSGNGDDVAMGGDGDDRIGGGLGNDQLSGDAGDDVIGAGLGDDTADGGDGNDLVNGGGGDDVLTGGAGNDSMGGSQGADTLSGGDGDDLMGGGTGMDVMSGGAGNDQMGGGFGNDMVDGGVGDDFVAGGNGRDTLLGGEGNDTINGGNGDDQMQGGDGADVFVFNSFNAGEVDVISDFDTAGDLLDLRGVIGGFEGLSIAATTFDGSGATQVSYLDHTIILVDVEATTLDGGDFIFG
ncbi:bifunctional hemolysin/adenylate cyclase [Roseovarius mucosus]|uniref:Bifunctional hemolysin/adenylate cyclase n=1 Tax=Roseovarius mucosus TaxID=215743 RepID=A0A1V0RJJ5_9RHOB|nr:calcium-binding protein [Roseovarius mucosus]ARE81948.1 bifunctional hemolysin/adenylate cyclase [Roseovarius mucosus]